MAKYKFIKIMLQMLRAYPPLVRPNQPSFQKGDDPICMGQRVLGRTVDSLNNPLEPHFCGNVFHREWWKFYDEGPEFKAVVQSWDYLTPVPGVHNAFQPSAYSVRCAPAFGTG